MNLAKIDNKLLVNSTISRAEHARSHLPREKSPRLRPPTLVKTTTSITTETQKGLKSFRARRLKVRKQSASKVRAQATLRRVKVDTRSSDDVPDDTGALEGEKPINSETDPFTALHAKVHELKRNLEAEDKSKRVTKIQLSRLKASNDPVVASSTQAGSVFRPLKESSRQHAVQHAGSASGTSDAPSSGTVTSNLKEKPQSTPKSPSTRVIAPDLFRVVSSTAKAASSLPKSMKPLKDALVNSVASAKNKSKVSKKADGTPPRSPRRVGSRKGAAIEVVNAEALKISGNCTLLVKMGDDLIIAAVEIDQPPVPNLSYGLDRVLFK